ncbi:hypothetical protein EDD21DRAFT_386775 [Dissophora ornata]|nr:hypothetical protein EDD21DRAFT_386775 [Dissophora ornata]
MAPHVPHSASSQTSSGSSSGPSRMTEHNQNNLSQLPTAAMASPGIDKKRARPLDEFSSSRKKVASELMAFEFESLSLSNSIGSAVQDGSSSSSGSQPQRHPPVQHQTVQERQWQLDQIRRQHHQSEQQSGQPQLRARAKSSPVGLTRVVPEQTVEIRSGEGSPDGGPIMLSSSSSLLVSPPATRQEFDRMYRPTLHARPMFIDPVTTSTPSSSSSFSPLSPPISPPPSASSASLDMSMLMDEGATITSRMLSQIPVQNLSRDSGLSSSSSSSSSSPSIKVLNLRQRKWNSVNKEWQEWQEVQATHTPDLPSSSGYTTQIPATSSSSGGSSSSSSSSPRPNGPESVSDVDLGASDPWRSGHDNELPSGGTSIAHPQPNGHGRQRSFCESGERPRPDHGGNTPSNDQKSAFGSRARSFSETKVNPYTQQQQQDQSQHQHDPYALISSQSLSPLYQMPVPQRANHSHAHADSNLQQYYQRNQSPHQPQRHSGHPLRHHSDHIYPYTGEWRERNGDGESGHSREALLLQGHQARTRHSQSSSGVSTPQYPWMALSMTALDGTMNIPGERPSRVTSGPTSAVASTSTGLSALGSRHEEQGAWNQQLLKSQNGYRDGYGGQRHGYGRASPVNYGYHQHSQEDVLMSEEGARPMPSRSSSPAPCLSMAPTVTRPLSISFSHLTGSNMLGNLSEHEQDDDMEL